MKKLFLLPLFALLAIFTACSSDEDNKQTVEPVVVNADYQGTIIIEENALPVICNFVYNESAKDCNVTIKGVKLAEMMPVVDIALKNIPCKPSKGKIEFEANDIVPYITMMGVSYEAEDYKIESVKGFVTEIDMSVSVTMSLGAFTFEGKYTEEKEEDAAESGEYVGTMAVLATGADEPFLSENIVCEMVINDDNSALDLIIYGARFAQNMPTTIDIKLQEIPYTLANGELLFSCEDTMIPLVRVGSEYIPMEAFSFSSIEGSSSAEQLYFVASMTRGDFAFDGKMKK